MVVLPHDFLTSFVVVILHWFSIFILQEEVSEEVEKKMKMSIVKMSAFFEDTTKAQDCFRKLDMVKNSRIFNLLGKLLNEQKTEDAQTTRVSLFHLQFYFLTVFHFQPGYRVDFFLSKFLPWSKMPLEFLMNSCSSNLRIIFLTFQWLLYFLGFNPPINCIKILWCLELRITRKQGKRLGLLSGFSWMSLIFKEP